MASICKGLQITSQWHKLQFRDISSSVSNVIYCIFNHADNSQMDVSTNVDNVKLPTNGHIDCLRT